MKSLVSASVGGHAVFQDAGRVSISIILALLQIQLRLKMRNALQSKQSHTLVGFQRRIETRTSLPHTKKNKPVEIVYGLFLFAIVYHIWKQRIKREEPSDQQSTSVTFAVVYPSFMSMMAKVTPSIFSALIHAFLERA